MTKAAAAFQQAFDRWLPYQCALVTSFVGGRMYGFYNRKFGISVAGWRMLATLNAHQPCSAGDLGRRAGTDAVQTTRVLASLAKKHLVRRVADRRDRRRAVLTLSPAGRRVVEAVAPLALSLEADLLRELSAAERKALQHAMFKLETVIDRIWRAEEGSVPAGVALPSEGVLRAKRGRRK